MQAIHGSECVVQQLRQHACVGLCSGWHVVPSLVALFLIPLSSAYGATITATSTSLSDVQAAISAASDGDTVVVPAGSATWSGLTINKGITLQGTSTTISGSINLQASASVAPRITGFTFTSNDAIHTGGSKTSKPFRIDHCKFTGGATMIQVAGNAPCLIDHNAFEGKGAGEMIHNLGMGASSTAGWTDDISPGGFNAVYIEGNTFTKVDVSGNPAYFWGCSALQSYYGARTVFRYNYLSMCQIDQHGTPGMIGARWWEIYGNTNYVVENGNQDRYMDLRAGSGVVFDNHKEGFANQSAGGIVLHEEDSGYPALYQIGRGKDQALDPAYLWDNDSSMPVRSGSTNVQADRDYFTSQKPGYTPFPYPYPLDANGLPDPSVAEPGALFLVGCVAIGLMTRPRPRRAVPLQS